MSLPAKDSSEKQEQRTPSGATLPKSTHFSLGLDPPPFFNQETGKENVPSHSTKGQQTIKSTVLQAKTKSPQKNKTIQLKKQFKYSILTPKPEDELYKMIKACVYKQYIDKLTECKNLIIKELINELNPLHQTEKASGILSRLDALIKTRELYGAGDGSSPQDTIGQNSRFIQADEQIRQEYYGGVEISQELVKKLLNAVLALKNRDVNFFLNEMDDDSPIKERINKISKLVEIKPKELFAQQLMKFIKTKGWQNALKKSLKASGYTKGALLDNAIDRISELPDFDLPTFISESLNSNNFIRLNKKYIKKEVRNLIENANSKKSSAKAFTKDIGNLISNRKMIRFNPKKAIQKVYNKINRDYVRYVSTLYKKEKARNKK